jgi:4'-phosphopantetheinyl transferase
MNTTEVDMFHVFLIDVRDHDYTGMIEQLSGACQERLARITHPRRREQFVLGRVLLRQALGLIHGPVSESWRLEAASGKPRLKGAGAPEISLSHSRELVACAISTVEIGLDVECCCERDFVSIAAQFCSDSELCHLQSLTHAEQIAFFYEMWTLKEATFKVSGRTDTGALGDMRYCYFRPRENYLAALAARSVAQIEVMTNLSLNACCFADHLLFRSVQRNAGLI